MNKDQLLNHLLAEQQANGCVSAAAIRGIARGLGVEAGEVYGVATFYSFLSLAPQGRHVIRVCKSIPCEMKASRDVAAWVSGHLGVEPGQTTADGRFTLELVNCIGACEQAPAMLVDDRLYGDLTPELVAEILKSLD